MDSISMYERLKEKHVEQEEILKENVTEKLTSVDIGSATGREFDVNKKKVRVDGRTKAVTAKSAFMSVYSKEYVDRLSEIDAKQITEDTNLQKIAKLAVKTKETAENLDTIHQYSANNTERNEKTRNKHREKVHQHAKQLILSSGVHRDAISKCDELMGKDALTAAEKKTLKKEFMKKYKLDLEVIEQEYQMNKNLLLMGGKKDISEEDSLFRLRYTRYAKAIAANKKGIEMAEKYPELFDAATFQKQIDKINKKLKTLGESASPALMESKRKYFTESNERRVERIKAKREAETEKRENAQIKEKHGERIQRAIDAYIEKKSENTTEQERLWLRENLSLDALLPTLREGRGSEFFLTDKHEMGYGDAFFKNFDEAMSLLIERFLFAQATQIPVESKKQLQRGGLTREHLDRSVRTQLHPVRRLKNGEYVGEQDRINDAFNMKYINGMIGNDMEARRACLEENIRMLTSYQFDLENFKIEDFYSTEAWKKMMLVRINLSISNLAKDVYSSSGSIQDNRAIAQEIVRPFEEQKVEVDGSQWDYFTFLGALTNLYEYRLQNKYNFSVGRGELTNDSMCKTPEIFDYFEAQLKTFLKKYRALQNNAGGQQ